MAQLGSSKVFGDLQVTGDIKYNDQIISNIVTGTAPLVVASTTTVTNLNADLLDGNHASAFSLTSHNHNGTYQPLDADLTSIAGLSGASGFLKKTAADTWSLDTNSYSLTSHTHNGANISQTIYTTTTATTEGYYRIATIPIGSQYKQVSFRIKGYTATGTVTESTIDINLAYYASNYSSQYSGITANTSHSYNSSTSAENGFVLLYCRVSFDATNAYIDMYKYKTTAVTMEVQPLTLNDWVWAVGVLTVNPTVGAYRSTTATLYYGLSGNNITASSASSATYSNYGVLGTNSISNTTDKTGQWEYIGGVEFDYNASYLRGRSLNVRCRLQEMSYDGTLTPDNMDDFCLNIQANLGYHANDTAFNSLIPTFNIEVDGKTSLTSSDICALVYSTSTSVKYIRIYIKLKTLNTVYAINPEQRYGRSFATSSYSQTTNYCYFFYAGDSTPLVSLPTPAQGSIVYASFRDIQSPNLTGTPTAPTATTGTNTTQIATTEFVQSALSAAITAPVQIKKW